MISLQAKDESAHLFCDHFPGSGAFWAIGSGAVWEHYWKRLTSYIFWVLIKLTALPEVFHLPGEGSARQPWAAGNSKCRTVPPCLEALRGQAVFGCSLLPSLHPHKSGAPCCLPWGAAGAWGSNQRLLGLGISLCPLISPTSSVPVKRANNACIL